jgi:hypothetical protein
MDAGTAERRSRGLLRFKLLQANKLVEAATTEYAVQGVDAT